LNDLLTSTIPLLKKTKYGYSEVFLSNIATQDDDEDYYDEICKKSPNVILDIFPHCLDRDSKEIKYLDSDYFRFINEEKYLNFICDVFEENDRCCYIEYDFYNYSHKKLIENMKRLDEVDILILLEQITHFNKEQNNKFMIDDANLLKLFLRGILRENMRLHFFFKKRPLMLFSNFDLSIPLAFKSIADLEYYKKIAKDNNLFFR